MIKQRNSMGKFAHAVFLSVALLLQIPVIE